ncbi:hypothetical protein BCR44DRAFT_1425578 [Catenaria anguillulae PL171]|uniref:Uncharacterized protein n=1 Tax=Catenaria anguillulae PL171 TaxID=765915 RepID=A0A1Y2I196_9FUNG|nr:hypothetical protein BCR44DRAFT_1425578 [Catenaria anguillulae PL171]
MPKDCTFKGCQSFHKRTFCIARQCQPRLTENATCAWDPRANFATREQPCEAGLVCSGSALSAKCVRNGPGPTDFSGKPEFPDLAAQSAAEKKDDSIPPRPAINPKEPSAENPGSGLEWWHYTLFGVFGVAFVFVVTMALKDRRFVLRSAKELVEARKQKLAAETAAALAQVHNKPVVAQSGQAGLAAPASLTEQPGQQGSNSGQAGTVVQIPIEEYLALQEHRQRQQQSAGPAVVSALASRQNGGQR